jgi:spore coat protein H
MWRTFWILIIATLLLLSGSQAAEEIVPIHITIAPEGIKSLQQNPTRDVPIVVQLQGKRITNCTAHLKGHGSFQPISSKPSFSIRSPKKNLFGRKKLLLNNSSQDPSFLKWKIASELFTKAGVPSPEVSFARVNLNGKTLGLYLMLEPTDKKFLKKHFSNDTGNLYEGHNQDMTDKLDRDNGEGDDAQTDRQRLAAACLEPDLQKRWTKLNEVLDVNRFLGFMATEVLVDHHDGYSMDRNNFRLYHNPADDKFLFLPHGLDLLFHSADLSHSRPFRSIVAGAILQTAQGKAAYDARSKTLANEFFGDEAVLKRVDELWNQIEADAPAESAGAVSQLKKMIEARIKLVQALNQKQKSARTD